MNFARIVFAVVLAVLPLSASAKFTASEGTPLRRDEVSVDRVVTEHKLASKLMAREMPYRVVLPPSYDQALSLRYPVVYLLHGLTGHYNNWTDKTSLGLGSNPSDDIIIVTPEGADSWYTDSFSKPNDKYESYIIKELIPEVDKKFRTMADREQRAIAGLSMGGYGAIKFGLKYPETFSLAGSFSGALGVADITEKRFPGAIGRSIDAVFGAPESDIRKANDPFLMIREASSAQIKKFPFLYVDCGTEDFLFKNNRDFVELLLEKGVPHEFRQLPGGHNWTYWNAQVQEFLELAGRKFDEKTAMVHPATRLSTDVSVAAISKLSSETVGRLSLVTPMVPAQQRTVIRDGTAARMLVGRHRLSLQWVSWDHFGVATARNRRGVYSLKGEQKGRGQNSDFVKVDGRITSIDAKEFTFDGTIVTQVSHINGGKPCTREGEFTFKITGKRRYWRLQQMDNPCDPVTDYVDVYFR